MLLSWFVKLLVFVVIIYLLICLVYLVFQEKIIFHPQKLDNSYVYQYQVPFQEVNISTVDGAILNGVLCKHSAKAKGVILYFHGNASHVFDLGWLGEKFYNLGYDALIMDYRSYGKSTGKLSQSNLFADAELIYQKLLGDYNSSDIIIYGRSIGSGIAIHLASKVKCQKLILETPYASLVDLAGYYTPYLPYSLLVRYPLESDKYMQQVTVPVYIFHGDSDSIVPYASGQKLADSTPSLAEFVTIKGGEHNNLSEYPSFYENLERILGE